jgi:cytochrome c556
MAGIKIRSLAGVVVTAALLAGCNAKPIASAPTPAATALTPAPPAPPFSVNELMVMIVDQPGELLWDVEKTGRAPKTAEDWYQLEIHAVSLASAASVIQLGGTGPNDNTWAADPVWRSSAEKLAAAALTARGAARAKNLPALILANGQIVEACEACHAKFKSDIPTGGLFLHKRPGIDQ